VSKSCGLAALCALAILTGGKGWAANSTGVQPEIFGASTISTRDDELAIAFAPDGNTAWFTKRSPTTNTTPRSIICVTRRVDGRWIEPAVATFSGTWNDFSTAVSSDGNRIVFASDRPTEPRRPAGTFDLWETHRGDAGWSEPRNLGAPINTDANESYPSLAADGTLYFASSRPGGKGASDIWRARWTEGHYAEPENLLEINTPGYESQPGVAPDQSYLVFASIGRADTMETAGAPYHRTDLYISFHNANGWSEPRNLGAPINSPFSELTPTISPDGRWLYFASDRSFVSLPMRRLNTDQYEADLHGLLNGWDNIYRVPISAIEHFRPSAREKQQ